MDDLISPLIFVDATKRMFLQAKAHKKGRLSIEWGKFSHDMNAELRNITDQLGDSITAMPYKEAYSYWLACSRAIDTKTNRHERRKAFKEARTIEKNIRGMVMHTAISDGVYHLSKHKIKNTRLKTAFNRRSL